MLSLLVSKHEELVSLRTLQDRKKEAATVTLFQLFLFRCLFGSVSLKAQRNMHPIIFIGRRLFYHSVTCVLTLVVSRGLWFMPSSYQPRMFSVEFERSCTAVTTTLHKYRYNLVPLFRYLRSVLVILCFARCFQGMCVVFCIVHITLNHAAG